MWYLLHYTSVCKYIGYLYVYVSIYIHLYTHTLTHTHTHTHTHIYIYTYICIYIYICVCIYIHIYIYIYVGMYSLLHSECHFPLSNLDRWSRSLGLFGHVLLRPMRLRLEIEIEWHSDCNRLYICIHVYISMHIYTYRFICICRYIYTYKYTYKYLLMHIYKFICTYVCIYNMKILFSSYIYVCVFIYSCIRTDQWDQRFRRRVPVLHLCLVRACQKCSSICRFALSYKIAANYWSMCAGKPNDNLYPATSVKKVGLMLTPQGAVSAK